MKFKTLTFINNEKSSKKLKALLLKEKLYLPKGALISILDTKKISLSSIDIITLIYDGEKPIGWAAIVGGFSPDEHPQDILPTYAHLSVFVKKPWRRKKLATKAINHLLKNFKKKNLIKEYSFSYLAHSSPTKLFKDLILAKGFQPRFFKGLYSSELKFIKE